jgi:hypothetical protein
MWNAFGKSSYHIEMQNENIICHKEKICKPIKIHHFFHSPIIQLQLIWSNDDKRFCMFTSLFLNPLQKKRLTPSNCSVNVIAMLMSKP